MSADVRPEAFEEEAWLEREARRYRDLTFSQRVAWFRDLERCMRALVPRGSSSRDGESEDLGARWCDPGLGKPR
jgi:hypothetical protein